MSLSQIYLRKKPDLKFSSFTNEEVCMLKTSQEQPQNHKFMKINQCEILCLSTIFLAYIIEQLCSEIFKKITHLIILTSTLADGRSER